MISQPKERKHGIVTFTTINQIGVLTIDNGSQNKIPQPDFIELNLLKEWLAMQELKGLVIVGQGRHFSAGADVDNIKANRNKLSYLEYALECGKELLNYIEALPMITVAAISGACFGGGLEIALSCQFRIAAENSMLAFPESNIGIMPGLAGTIRLPRIIGRRKALEIIISGRTISAEEALEIGLIDEVVSNKQHLAAAIQLIERLTDNRSIQQIKYILRSINTSIANNETAAMKNEGEMFVKLVKNLKGD
ncbi:MAG: fadJ [Clostridia bacterium]|jgi:enoyl-CoA hydratase|nr:fadJ [Clostridia bacterium]